MSYLVVWCVGDASSVLRKSVNLLKIKTGILSLLLLVATFFPIKAEASVYVYGTPPYTSPIYGCFSGGCCSMLGQSGLTNMIHEMFTGTVRYAGQPDLQNSYYLRALWPNIDTVLHRIADEGRNAVLFSLSSIGALMDGQSFNQSLLALQKQNVDSLQSEAVSDQICRFGTLSRSLANSDDRARLVQQGLSTRMQHRQLLKINMSSGSADTANRELGRSADKADRWAQFKSRFCDPSDSNAALANLCTATSDANHNRDIDISRSLDVPLTLDINFTNNAAPATVDEQNIFALSSNLYANDLALNLGKSDFNQIKNEDSTKSDNRLEKLFDWRSAIAKRSVAQNSFAAIAGMKAAGSGASANYMREIIRELGLTTPEDLTASLGDNPSYYAQMEVLTRKLYQSPKFYANLMDSPANVGRQQTAMGGIELMQDRDIYESLRRSEMLMSSILEIYVLREQDGFKERGIK